MAQDVIKQQHYTRRIFRYISTAVHYKTLDFAKGSTVIWITRDKDIPLTHGFA